MQTCACVASLPQSAIDTLAGAGLTPADVIDWIKAHGFQGADLLRKLLPLLPLDPNVKAVVEMILNLLYPPTPVPNP